MRQLRYDPRELNRPVAAIAASWLAVCSTGAARVPTDHESAGNQSFWVEQITDGLNLPSSMAFLPNGDLLIPERTGHLRILRHGRLDPVPVRGTPVSFPNASDGLKDIALDPDYAVNQTVYLLISEGSLEQRHAAVYRARYSDQGLTSVERIFRSKDEISGYLDMAAARMLLLADKTLLLGIPCADAHKQKAQQLDSHLGKVLRIARDGSVPKDNPLLSTPGALPEIFTYGHRAQLGFYQDPQSGVIFELDSGPRGGDELNALKAGANYGWPEASWGFTYDNSGAAAPRQSAPGMEDPIFIWTYSITASGMPSITPSGLTRYHGKIYPLWDGDYFFGHLSGRAIGRFRLEGSQVVLQETLLLDLKERVRDVALGPDHHLYILTDSQNARLLRLQPGHPSAAEQTRVAQPVRTPPPEPYVNGPTEALSIEGADPAKGKEEFLKRCAICHRVGTAVPGGEFGPDLAGVYGRRAGEQTGYTYSAAMTKVAQTWNLLLLNQFLANPDGFLPGTKMTTPGVTDAPSRHSIVRFLQQQSAEH